MSAVFIRHRGEASRIGINASAMPSTMRIALSEDGLLAILLLQHTWSFDSYPIHCILLTMPKSLHPPIRWKASSVEWKNNTEDIAHCRVSIENTIFSDTFSFTSMKNSNTF
jgi:hypothetical protein